MSTKSAAKLPGPVTFGDADLVQWGSDTNTATVFFSEESFIGNLDLNVAKHLPLSAEAA